MSVTLENKKIETVAFLCTGRVNPAISATIGFFLQRYSDLAPQIRLISFRNGFRGLLTNDLIPIGPKEMAVVPLLIHKGGSPIGGSRVRLHNTKHLADENLIKSGENPYVKCAEILAKNKVDVLHIIGSTSAQMAGKAIADLMKKEMKFQLTVVGIPKTIENDIGPIRRTLGAVTAAKGGAHFFNNVVAEHNANPRMLIIHEIKGRAGGWLTAATALAYRHMTQKGRFAPALGLSQENYDVHAIYTPEMNIDLTSEISRLKRVMDRVDNVNIFIAQGTFAKEIEAEAASANKDIKKHARLGYTLTEPASWLAAKIKNGIKAEKVLIQKSGIFVRAQEADREDLVLAQSLVNSAVTSALNRKDGVVGNDDGNQSRLRCIEHYRLKSGKKFDLGTTWFVEMLAAIGQPQAVTTATIPFSSML